METSAGTMPPQYLIERVEDVIGKKAIRWDIPDCGLSAALRFSVLLEDKRRVFVKSATDEDTEEWLRTEYLVLSALQKEFMPGVIGWIDQPGTHPILISEDLSHAYWPASHQGVAWREGDLDRLFSAIRELSSQPVPAELPPLQNRTASLWARIAGRPEPLLGLGLCSEKWFGQSLDVLVEAETALDVTGNHLVHGDVRSDNICVLGSQVVFVDWSHAARGYGRHDLATVLPTLHLEGGPAPDVMMPDGGREAASGCAVHIARLASDQQMPLWLRGVFKRLIAIELVWAARCLNLDEPDGMT